MANMSYCRFQNTRNYMEDCLEDLRDEKNLSEDEADAGYRMFDDILRFCRESGIIHSYDGEALMAFFEGLTVEEDDDE